MKKRYWRSQTFASNELKVEVRTKRTKSDIESVKILLYRENSKTPSPVPKSSSLKSNTRTVVQSRTGVRVPPGSPAVKQRVKREEDKKTALTTLVQKLDRQNDVKETRIPGKVKSI
jgi:hypothetical protein